MESTRRNQCVVLELWAPILEKSRFSQQTLEKRGLQLWIQSCYSSSTNHFQSRIRTSSLLERSTRGVYPL
jgi:hypothetical protein